MGVDADAVRVCPLAGIERYGTTKGKAVLGLDRSPEERSHTRRDPRGGWT
jgi:hypothetical protein